VLGYRVELGLATLLGALAADHVVGAARARPAVAAQQ
jgi:hypothetical protein